MKQKYVMIAVTEKTQEKLLRRKSTCAWKTQRPRLTWDEFLLKTTEKWEDKNKGG